jgi:biopolymer transport protein ExbB
MPMDFVAQVYAYIQPGGIVMFPLVISSVCMWVLIIDRVLYYRQLGRDDIPLRQAVRMLAAKAASAGATGLRAGVVAAFLAERTGDRDLDKKILDRCAMRARPSIRRALALIATLAAVAPLFGLLGTVTGMITTFDVIALFGTGNPKAMAGGISEALITTQSGLTAAIPGLFMSTYLMRRAGRLEGRLDETVAVLKRHL